ncbi:MAG: LysR family transcriptional regulator [Xanthobacteraceae bacterium]|jgi:DNA-binding transcriptional LysR family regulator|uniref:LysR family transcriptional regulator n=1 Tax=Pseudolabrys sp. TaxID=1960880 RepID=UPI003D0B73FF
MQQGITIRQLRGLVTLAQTGGVTAAANKLGLSQSGLSLLLQTLETSVDARLIDRSARPLRLTLAGERFVAIAERILEDVELASSSVRDDGSRGGRIIVAALPTLAAALLPQAMARFRRQHPHVTIQVRDALTEEIVTRVRAGDAHLGLGAFLDVGEGLATQPLLRDRLMLLAGRNFGDGKKTTWRAAAKHPLVMLTRDSNIRQLADRVFVEQRLQVRPAFEVSYISTAVALVQAGFGLTLVPQLEARFFNRSRLRALTLAEPFVDREISLLRRRNMTMTPYLRDFVDIVAQMQVRAK